MSVLLLSGGVDSAVLLADMIERGERPVCLSFSYGQRHVRELRAARTLAHHYRCRHEVVSLPPWVFSGSTLTGRVGPMSGSDTVVPARNLAFLSMAVAFAASRELKAVYLAAHAGDRDVYPDCRPGFISHVQSATFLGYNIDTLTPFIGMKKDDIVRRGRELAVPFESTYSCYAGEIKPCGECGACVGRRAAGL